VRWQILLAVSAFTLVLLDCRGPVSATQLVGNRILVTLWASKNCLDYGETVTLRATATNQGSLPFAIELTDRPVFDIVVGYPEEARWSAGKPLTPDLTRLELKPGQSKTIEMQWIATTSSMVFAPFISRSRYMDTPMGPSLVVYVGECPDWGLRGRIKGWWSRQCQSLTLSQQPKANSC